MQTEFLRELNRVFDLPPPVPEDIINMGIHDKVEPIDRRTIPTAAQLVAFDRLRWPGFGKQFKQAEIVTLGVIALSLKEAAIDRSIDKSRRRLHFSADYLTADQAGTLGWAISWGGRSNVLTPLDAERQPALGLAGWLANLPHRPRNLSTVRWQSQIINWLRTDLSNSAETWQRICKAMSTQNQFVLEPGVCPPSVYARRH